METLDNLKMTMDNPPVRGFHTRYNPAPHPGFQTEGPSKTDQSFATDSDINNLVRRFVKNGGNLYDPATLLNAKPSQPRFGDFSNIPDLLVAATEITRAQEMFAQLPAEVRDFFSYDPLRLLAFIEEARKNPELRQKAVQLGLMEKSAGAGSALPANEKRPGTSVAPSVSESAPKSETE